MKKFIISLLSIIPLVCSCSQNQASTELSIITPTGAPALAFYRYAKNKNFETNSGEVTFIIASMLNQKKDIVILPTNAGIQQINKNNLNYKIAATITFGNLYVAATGNDDDGVMDNDDYIILFQKNQLPDLIFKYIYGDSLNDAIHYVGAATDAAKCLKSGIDLTNDNHKVDYVLLAEPALTNILNSAPQCSIYSNLQDLYKEKSGGLEIFQASIFINSNLDKEIINNFLSSLEEAIKTGIQNPEKIIDGLNEHESPSTFFGIDPKIIPSVINKKRNGLGLGFKKAYENKQAIDKFLSIFGIGETDEKIYFK